MKRFACLLLTAVLLLSGCQLSSQQESTPTKAVSSDHIFVTPASISFSNMDEYYAFMDTNAAFCEIGY